MAEISIPALTNRFVETHQVSPLIALLDAYYKVPSEALNILFLSQAIKMSTHEKLVLALRAARTNRVAFLKFLFEGNFLTIEDINTNKAQNAFWIASACWRNRANSAYQYLIEQGMNQPDIKLRHNFFDVGETSLKVATIGVVATFFFGMGFAGLPVVNFILAPMSLALLCLTVLSGIAGGLLYAIFPNPAKQEIAVHAENFLGDERYDFERKHVDESVLELFCENIIAADKTTHGGVDEFLSGNTSIVSSPSAPGIKLMPTSEGVEVIDGKEIPHALLDKAFPSF